MQPDEVALSQCDITIQLNTKMSHDLGSKFLGLLSGMGLEGIVLQQFHSFLEG